VKKLQYLGLTVLVLIVCFFVFARGSLVSEEEAVRALETHGFSEIVVKEHAYFFINFRGGGREDVARFECEATNPAGTRVTVYVFAGWPFKGATIRSP
jgi:hypothetical protein